MKKYIFRHRWGHEKHVQKGNHFGFLLSDNSTSSYEGHRKALLFDDVSAKWLPSAEFKIFLVEISRD